MKRMNQMVRLFVVSLISACFIGCEIIHTTVITTGDTNATAVCPPKHRASFLFDNANTRVMNILSMQKSEAGFQQTVQRCKNNKDTVIYLYFSNAGDGQPATTSFYVNDQYAGAVDLNKVNVIKNRLKYCNDQRLGVIAWLWADDSSSITRQPMSKHMKYVEDVISIFDGYIYQYCIGIECNEYFSDSQVAVFVDKIKKATNKRVGVHWAPGKTSLCGANYLYYQYGFGLSTSQMKSATQQQIRKIGDKSKFIAAEYSKDSDKGGKALGDAALSVGAAGTGNGATK